MQITGGVNIRAAWYDRTPIGSSIEYDAQSVAAHAETVRDTHTVSANKKLMINSFNGSCGNIAASGATDLCYIKILVTPVVGDPYIVNSVESSSAVNNIGVTMGSGAGHVLNAGDQVDLITFGNGATSFRFLASLSYTEFDA